MVQTLRAREETEAWPGAAAPKLHALVLAAGQGARYGGAKLLAPWRGAPVLHGALRAAFAAPVQTVTVVTGAHADEVAACARAFAFGGPDAARLHLVHASDHADGLSASLRRGLSSLPADADGLMLFLGDMPGAPDGVLQPLAAALAAGAPAAAPRCRGRRGHPVAISRALFPELMTLTGDRGAAAVLADLGETLQLIDTEDDGVLLDIDAPADLEKAGAI